MGNSDGKPMPQVECIACGEFNPPLNAFASGLTFKWQCSSCGAKCRVDVSNNVMVALLESPLDIACGIHDSEVLPYGPPIDEYDIYQYLLECELENRLCHFMVSR